MRQHASPTRPAAPAGHRPGVLLVHSDPAYAAGLARSFRGKGWEARVAPSGAEARHLVQSWAPSLVLIDTELHPESGWLLCEKLLQEQPGLKVVLLRPDPTPENHEFATFVGASGVLDQGQDVVALVGHLELPLAAETTCG